jgi:hypothetical protein
MSEKSQKKQSSAQTCVAEGFRARTYRQPVETEAVSTGSDLDSGLNLPASLASYDPDTLSWRTSQRSVLGGWTEFSETWPRSGMVVYGTAYPLPQSAPATFETGGSASGGRKKWPTPNATDGSKAPRFHKSGNPSLPCAVEMGEGARSGDGSRIRGAGALNPDWVALLRGFPKGYLDLE